MIERGEDLGLALETDLALATADALKLLQQRPRVTRRPGRAPHAVARVAAFRITTVPSITKRPRNSSNVSYRHAFAVNRQRSLDAEGASSFRLRTLPDSFLEVDQSLVVAKGDRAKLPFIERFVKDFRASGFIKASIDRGKPRWRGRRIRTLVAAAGRAAATNLTAAS